MTTPSPNKHQKESPSNNYSNADNILYALYLLNM